MQLLRRRAPWAAFGVAVAVAALVLGACASGDGSPDAGTTTSAGESAGGVGLAGVLGGSGTLFEPPPPAADFTLTDEDGNRVLLADFRGEVLAIYFGYTHCPDVCPLTLGTYKAALERLPVDVSEQVKVLLISVDPDRDTPEVLKRYTDLFGAPFVGVTGSLEEVDDVLASWGIDIERGTPNEHGSYAVDHPAASWIVDQEGRLRVKVAHMTGTDALAADLQAIVEEGN